LPTSGFDRMDHLGAALGIPAVDEDLQAVPC
jgi:hypothetical protein